MSLVLHVLGPAAVLAYAVLGGVFLAFSDFIMRALSLQRGGGGVEAMQAINREVFRWVFMPLFLGMAVVSLALAAFGVFAPGALGGRTVAAAGLVYLLGCFAVTVVGNVPMNERLARLDRNDETSLVYWTDRYLPRWTTWNTVRTVACVSSAALLMHGLQSSTSP
ncbi:MAG TPA: anthrone oxygenase family protein [Paracoccaceae bacterium]|nr:anthrone oxygenase family protein [Paracoccaceae bacterium]